MDKNVYILSDNQYLSLNKNFIKINDDIIINNDIVHGFIGNIKYFIYKNKILYFIEIKEKSFLFNLEIEYDTIIYTNNELLNIYTYNFDFYNIKYDSYFIDNYEYDVQIWYFYYFKKNIDILMLINTFQKIQNISIYNYIGNFKNYLQYNHLKLKENIKLYFMYIFGKYNIIVNDICEIFHNIIIYMYKYKCINVDYLYEIFKNYEYMLLFIEKLFKEVSNIFYSETGKLKMKLDNIIINMLIIYFYSRYYIAYINDFIYKINLKDFNDLLFFKKLYIYSMCDFKIIEYIYLNKYYADILKNNKLIEYDLKHILYDFHFVDYNIKLIKYKFNDKDDIFKFIKNKYNFLNL